MGTRYNISTKDINKLVEAGVASIMDETEVWKEEWLENHYCYEQVAILARIAHVAIGGWQFSCVVWDAFMSEDELSGLYTGPNWGKEELDEIFKQNGIEVDYF